MIELNENYILFFSSFWICIQKILKNENILQTILILIYLILNFLKRKYLKNNLG
jgi:hypothetical protein